MSGNLTKVQEGTKNSMKRNMYEMFKGQIDTDVIDMVLSGCGYKEDLVLEQLLAVAEKDEVEVIEKPEQIVSDKITYRENNLFNQLQNEDMKGHMFENYFPHDNLFTPTNTNSASSSLSNIPLFSDASTCQSMSQQHELYKDESSCDTVHSVISDIINNPLQSGFPANMFLPASTSQTSLSSANVFLPASTSQSRMSPSFTHTPPLPKVSLTQNTTTDVIVSSIENACSSSTKKGTVSYSNAAKSLNTDISNEVPLNRKNPYSKRSSENHSSEYVTKHRQRLMHLIETSRQPVLIILRGLPGSGKSYLGSKLKGNHGLIVCADDFFTEPDGTYNFDPSKLGEAHQWCHRVAKKGMEGRVSPIIIDNTNTELWEMKPYVAPAFRLGYHIEFVEPQTPWAWNVKELTKRNSHGLSKDKIRMMLDRYQRSTTIEKVLASNRVFKELQHPSNRPCKSSYEKKGSPCKVRDVSSGNKYHDLKNRDLLQENIHNSQLSTEMDSIEISTSSTEGNSKRKCNTVESPEFLGLQLRRKDRKKNDTLTPEKDFSPLDHYFSKTDSTVTMDTNTCYNEDDTNSPMYSNEGSLSNDNIRRSSQKSSECSKEGSGSTEVLLPTEISIPTSRTLTDCTSEQTVSEPGSSNIPDTLVVISELNEDKEISDIDFHSSLLSLQDPTSGTNTKVDLLSDMSPLKEFSVMEISGGSDSFSPEKVHGIRQESNVNLDFLYGCFPVYKKKFLRNWLDRYNGDLLKTCDYLSRLSQPDVLPEFIVLDSDDEGGEDADDEPLLVADYTVKAMDIDENTLDNNPITLPSASPRPGPSTIKEDIGRQHLKETKQYMNESERGELFYCDNESELGGNALMIALDQRLASELKSRYHMDEALLSGDINNEDLVIPINEDLAKELYKSWIYAIQDRKRKRETTTMEDEQLAKRLQREEEETGNKVVPKKKKGKSLISIETEYSRDKSSTLKGTGVFDDNPWTSPNKSKHPISSQEHLAQLQGQLCQMYPGVEQETLNELLSAHNNDIHLTAEAVQTSCNLNTMSSPNNVRASPKPLRSQEQIINDLCQVFPGEDKQRLEQALESCNFDIERAAIIISNAIKTSPQKELNKRSINLHSITASKPEHQWSKVKSSNDKSSQSPPQIRKKLIPGLADEETAVMIDSSSDQSLYQTWTDPDYRDWRAEAQLHANQRAECFQKAAKAHQEKKGELAQYYAQEAHKHQVKSKEAHARAAEVILKFKNKQHMTEQRVIDLHGLHGDEAVNALYNFLQNALRKHFPSVEVITGRGNNSKGGFSIVRKKVLEFLDRQGFPYQSKSSGGAVVVKLRRF